jgi:hypothetical protein
LPSHLRRPNPHSPGFHRNDRSGFQLGLVQFGRAQHSVRLCRSGKIDQADDSVVTDVADNRQLAEILVERNDAARLGDGLSEQFVVTGIFREIGDPEKS